MDIIPRDLYLKRITPYIDKPLVKVISGTRRCGKSTILKLLRRHLLEQGVAPDQIIYINKESLQFEEVRSYRDLYTCFESAEALLPKERKRYLFVDEVQEIEGWERTVASLLAEGRADIYITGSNARLLSSELATLLAGRYVEISVYPLTFAEFVSFQKSIAPDTASIRDLFPLYLRFGGFPGLHSLPLHDQVVFPYLDSLFDSILLKDVVQRYNLREPAQLERIVRFLFDNCGNVTTAKRISDYLKSQRSPLSVTRVQNYLSYLEHAFLLYRVPRFDLKGLRFLELYDKYYVGDIGLRHGLIGYRDSDIGGLLENVVYLELLTRGYAVSIGKLGDREVDFIAQREKEQLYIQVTYLLADETTRLREFSVLQLIEDSYPKLVLSMDSIYPEDTQGIRWMNLLDWLMEG